MLHTRTHNEPKRVAIWLRVSTEDQAKGESPEHHEKRARLYAEAKGWTVVTVYDLSGVSGKSVMAHPECKRMLEDVRGGRISGLIFSKLARLARNTRELLEFSEIFREHGADLVSLQESIDTSSPAGRLLYTMISALAQWEREEIADRVSASVPIRAALGKQLGGQAVYGYQWVDGRLIPHPEEAPVRRLICELFIEHRRKKAVARVLNERGYRTRNGSAWTDTTIERLIRDPTAKGLHRANYTKTANSKRAWKLKPETDWVYTEVEAIVPAPLWERANHALDLMRQKRTPRSRETVHLFSGFAICHCGHKMYVPSNTPKYVCYSCRNKIPVMDLEAIFQEQLHTFVLSDDEIEAYLGDAKAGIREREERIEHLLSERDRVRREMDKVYALYLADEITKDGFGDRYRPLEERLKQLNDQLPVIQAEVDALKINLLSSDQIVADTRDLYARWHTLSREEKRFIIEAITERIEVGEGDIAIHLNYLPTHPSLDGGSKATRPQGFIAATSWTEAG